MKKISINIYLIILITFYGCKKIDSDTCSQSVEVSNIEISRGNVYYFHKMNYSQIIEYEIFKKYGFVNYLEFYPIAADSCFRKVMNKKIEAKINGKISLLDKETEKLKHYEETMDRFNKYKFSDSIYCTIGGDAEYPLMKYPMYLTDFQRDLLDSIKGRFDKNYISSSFWIVINKKGRIESIERYKKHSNEVDSYIEKKLKKTVWFPSLHKKDSTFVKSRIEFILKG